MTAELVSFDAKRVERYLDKSLAGFLNDPADTDYQRGFLAALIVVWREALNKDDDRIKLLDAQT